MLGFSDGVCGPLQSDQQNVLKMCMASSRNVGWTQSAPTQPRMSIAALLASRGLYGLVAVSLEAGQ